MPWKKGTKIAKFDGQVQARRALKRLSKQLKVGTWLSQEDVDELTNIILDYWGSMGPDCQRKQLEAASV